MSKEIDERVVEMRFNNASFEQNAAKTMSTLDKLKSKLNFGSVKNSVNSFGTAVDANMSSVAQSTNKVQASFSALQVVAMTTLSRITNSAISFGANIAKSLTIDPVKSGLSEYELKLSSIQTILANTKRHGSTLEDVSDALDELNHYADLTIYNFGQMTTAIGMFTTAGVKLDRSVASVKGISNLAAFVGAPASDATRAMYQLSQALSTGSVRLQDWMSLERTAGMAGVEFQDRLKDTARILGTNVDAAIKKNGNFRESLKEGWLTTEVLTETLKQFAGEVDEIYLKQQGWNDAQIQSIIELGKTATESATVVKSFTQLLDTSAEAAQSGWAESWELIIGDLDEAKKLWTGASKVISGMIDASAAARNKVLRGWKDLGGRTMLLDSLKEAYKNLSAVMEPVNQAFKEMFPPTTAQRLLDLTKSLKNFTEQIKISEETAYTLKVAVKALLLPVRILFETFKVGASITAQLAIVLFKMGDSFLSLFSKASPLEWLLRKIFGNDRYVKLSESMGRVVKNLSNGVSRLTTKLKGLKPNVDKVGESFSIFKKIADYIKPITDGLLDKMVDGFDKLSRINFSQIKTFGKDILSDIKNKLKDISDFFSPLTNGFKALSAEFENRTITERLTLIKDAFVSIKNEIVSFIKGGFLGEALGDTSDKGDKFKEVLEALGEAIVEFTSKLSPAKILVFSFGTAIVGTMFSLNNVLKSFNGLMSTTTTVIKSLMVTAKPSKIADIARALTILAGALTVMSLVDPVNLRQATVSMLELMAALTVMTTVMGVLDRKLIKAKSFVKTTASLQSMAISIAALSGALLMLSKVEMGWDLVGKVAAIGTLMFALAGAMKVMENISPGVNKSAVFVLAFALSISSIVKALEKLKDVDSKAIISGLGSIVVMMGILGVISAISSKTKFGSATGILVMCFNLLLIATVLKKLAKINPSQLAEGLVGFIPIMYVLAEIAIVSKLAGDNILKAGGGILAMSAAIIILGQAIKNIGALSISEVAKGTAAVSAILVLFTAITGISKFSGEHSAKVGKAILAMSASILLLGISIKYLGGLDTKVVIQGTAAVGALLTLFTILTVVGGKAKSGAGSIIALTASLGLLISGLVLLTMLPADEVFKSAEALSLIMVSLGAALYALSRVSDVFKKIKMGAVVKEMAVLVTIGGTLAGLVAIMTKIPSDDSIVKKAEALAIIITTMTGAFFILNKTKVTDYAELAAKLMGIDIAMLSASMVISQLTEMNVDATIIQKATALSEVLLAASGAIGILSIVKLDAKTALTAILVLGAVIVELGALIEVAGAIMQSDKAKKFAEDGVIFFGKMGEAIGAFSGGIITKVGEAVKGLREGREDIGTRLSNMMDNLQPFLSSVQNIDDSTVTGVKNLSKVFIALSGASFINAIGNFMTLGQGSKALGETVDNIVDPIAKFAKTAEGIPTNVVGNSAKISEALSKLLVAIPTEGGALSIVTGKVNLDSFATQITALGDGIKSFSVSITSGDGISAAAVENATHCAEIVATLYDKLPETGGWMQAIFGEADLSVFGSQLRELGIQLLAYSNIITTGDGINKKAIEASASAAGMLADLYDKLPSNGGWMQTIFGEKDLGPFATSLVTLGNALSNYSTIITAENGINKDAVQNSADAAQILVDLQDKLSPTGGKWQTIFGEKDMGVFAKSLSELGDALATYSQKISAVDLAAIQNSVDSIIALTTVEIGEKSVRGIQEGIQNSVEKLKATISSMAAQTVQKAKEAFNIQGLHSEKFKTIGKYTIEGLIKGINEKAPYAYNAMTTVGQNLVSRIQAALLIQSPSKVMRDEVGRYVVMGIAEGISADTSAEEAAEKKASNITNAFKSAFDAIDLRVTTASLENQLWQALNPNASEAELAKRQKELLDQNLKAQAETVRTAEAEYQATIQVLGESSTQAKQAYNKLLQEKIELAQLAQQLAGDRKNAADDSMVAYARLMGENKDMLTKLGYSEEQIKNWAEQMSGFKPGGEVTKKVESSLDEAMAKGDIQGIMQAYLDPIPEVVVKTVDTGIQNGSARARSGGQAIGSSLGTGIQEGVNEKKDDISNTINDVVSGETSVGETINKVKNDFSGSFASLLDGGITSIEQKTPEVLKSIGDMGTGVINKLRSVWDEHSPSKEFQKIGNDAMDGLILGIRELDPILNMEIENAATKALSKVSTSNLIRQANIESHINANSAGVKFMETFSAGISASENKVVIAINGVTTTMSKAIESTYPKFKSNGLNLATYMVQGLVKGIQEGKSGVINSAVEMAVAAYEAAKKSLLISSPSKKFEELGKYAGMGFAQGLYGESGRVADASNTLVDSTLDSTTSAILHANSIIEDQNYAPIIRPVIDLQQVQDTMSTLDNYYSTDLVSTVNNGIRSNTKLEKSKMAASTKSYMWKRGAYKNGIRVDGITPKLNIGQGRIIVFNQTNNSPKALSSSTIYRNTKNQFAAISKKNGSSIGYRGSGAGTKSM